MTSKFLCPALVLVPVLSSGAALQESGAAVFDPVSAAVSEVSGARLLANVEKLAGFGTRHTAGETASDERGIGAARRWIEAELRSISEQTGDRLDVRTQSFQQELAIDDQGATKEVELVNV